MDVIVQGVPCVAGILPYGQPDAQLILTVVVKATFKVEGGALVPDDDPVPLWELDEEWEGHRVLRDLTPMKAGCDLILLGEAHSPGGQPAGMMNVTVMVGGAQRALIVWGDRRWERARGGWRPSPPAPFTRLPLCFERAFGGTALTPFGELQADGNNPVGQGLQLLDDPEAIGRRALPNIEAPGQQMKAWSDRPLPAGCAYYPSTWGLRLRQGVEVGADHDPVVKPIFFNQAHPDFILPAFPDSEILSIVGMTPGDPFSVRITPPDLTARLVGLLQEIDMPLRWDTLGVLPGQGRLFMIGRAAFRYDPNLHWAAEVHVTARTQEAT